jgi:hypothetical protein
VKFPSSGHHARGLNFNLSLCYIEIKQKNKDKKEIDGLGKSALWMKVPHTLYKGTHE